MNFTGTPANFEHVLKQADRIDYDSGLTSYIKYNILMRALADRYACTPAQATAVFVSTSPNNDYVNNLRSTVSILAGYQDAVPMETVTISTYHHCRARAWSYLNGVDFLATTKGPKIKSFYRNILDPQDPEPVTIDGHMVGAWSGKRVPMKEAAVGGFSYEAAARDLREVAKKYYLVPCQLQGILWFTWKRLHRVVYNGNLDLWGDHWGLDVDVRHIRPFPRKRLPVK